MQGRNEVQGRKNNGIQQLYSGERESDGKFSHFHYHNICLTSFHDFLCFNGNSFGDKQNVKPNFLDRYDDYFYNPPLNLHSFAGKNIFT